MIKKFRRKELKSEINKTASVTNKKILIVEDNELNARLFTELLKVHGYETAQTGEGLKVINHARDFQPDLILMDIQLPDESGLEVSRWIRQDDALQNIPIIAVTAFAMKGDEKRVEQAGCQTLIAKPIIVSSFLETIHEILDREKIEHHSNPKIRQAHDRRKGAIEAPIDLERNARPHQRKAKLLKNLRKRLKDELAAAEEFYINESRPKKGIKTPLTVALKYACLTADDKGAETAFKAFLWSGLGKGNVLALARLAKYYREGIGTEPDLAISNEFLHIAAELGDTDSQEELARL